MDSKGKNKPKVQDTETHNTPTVVKLDNSQILNNQNNQISSLDVKSQLDLMTSIVKGKKFINVNSPEDALAIFYKAKGLGLDWANAIDHFYNINDKTSVDFHIIVALVLRPMLDITWEVVKYAEIQYQYTLKIDNVVQILYNVDELPSNKVIISPITSKSEINKIKNEGNIPVIKQPHVLFTYSLPNGNVIKFINKKTVIRFERLRKLSNGEYKVLTIISEFTNQIGFDSGILYLKDGKTLALDKSWFKYNDNQLYVRSFTQGARRIGDDALMGLYETTELYDANNIDYRSEGGATIIQE